MNRAQVPLPLGEGGAKRRVRVASLFQILRPSPCPLPAGEGGSSAIPIWFTASERWELVFAAGRQRFCRSKFAGWVLYNWCSKRRFPETDRGEEVVYVFSSGLVRIGTARAEWRHNHRHSYRCLWRRAGEGCDSGH